LPSDSPSPQRRPGHDPPPEPAGFGNCGSCAYRFSGSVDTCFHCARSTFESLPSNRCPLCEGKVAADCTCGNPL
jgi:hypothetical protein